MPLVTRERQKLDALRPEEAVAAEQLAVIDAVIAEARVRFKDRTFDYEEALGFCEEVDQLVALQNLDAALKEKVMETIRPIRVTLMQEIREIFKKRKIETAAASRGKAGGAVGATEGKKMMTRDDFWLQVKKKLINAMRVFGGTKTDEEIENHPTHGGRLGAMSNVCVQLCPETIRTAGDIGPFVCFLHGLTEASLHFDSSPEPAKRLYQSKVENINALLNDLPFDAPYLRLGKPLRLPPNPAGGKSRAEALQVFMNVLDVLQNHVNTEFASPDARDTTVRNTVETALQRIRSDAEAYVRAQWPEAVDRRGYAADMTGWMNAALGTVDAACAQNPACAAAVPRVAAITSDYNRQFIETLRDNTGVGRAASETKEREEKAKGEEWKKKTLSPSEILALMHRYECKGIETAFNDILARYMTEHQPGMKDAWNAQLRKDEHALASSTLYAFTPSSSIAWPAWQRACEGMRAYVTARETALGTIDHHAARCLIAFHAEMHRTIEERAVQLFRRNALTPDASAELNVSPFSIRTEELQSIFASAVPGAAANEDAIRSAISPAQFERYDRIQCDALLEGARLFLRFSDRVNYAEAMRFSEGFVSVKKPVDAEVRALGLTLEERHTAEVSGTRLREAIDAAFTELTGSIGVSKKELSAMTKQKTTSMPADMNREMEAELQTIGNAAIERWNAAFEAQDHLRQSFTTSGDTANYVQFLQARIAWEKIREECDRDLLAMGVRLPDSYVQWWKTIASEIRQETDALFLKKKKEQEEKAKEKEWETKAIPTSEIAALAELYNGNAYLEYLGGRVSQCIKEQYPLHATVWKDRLERAAKAGVNAGREFKKEPTVTWNRWLAFNEMIRTNRAVRAEALENIDHPAARAMQRIYAEVQRRLEEVVECHFRESVLPPAERKSQQSPFAFSLPHAAFTQLIGTASTQTRVIPPEISRTLTREQCDAIDRAGAESVVAQACSDLALPQRVDYRGAREFIQKCVDGNAAIDALFLQCGIPMEEKDTAEANRQRWIAATNAQFTELTEGVTCVKRDLLAEWHQLSEIPQQVKDAIQAVLDAKGKAAQEIWAEMNAEIEANARSGTFDDVMTYIDAQCYVLRMEKAYTRSREAMAAIGADIPAWNEWSRTYLRQRRAVADAFFLKKKKEKDDAAKKTTESSTSTATPKVPEGPRGVPQTELIAILLQADKDGEKGFEAHVGRTAQADEKLRNVIEMCCPQKEITDVSQLERLIGNMIGRLSGVDAVLPAMREWMTRLRENRFRECEKALQRVHASITGDPSGKELLQPRLPLSDDRPFIGTRTLEEALNRGLRKVKKELLTPYASNNMKYRVIERYFDTMRSSYVGFLAKYCGEKIVRNTREEEAVVAFIAELMAASPYWCKEAGIHSKEAQRNFQDRLCKWLDVATRVDWQKPAVKTYPLTHLPTESREAETDDRPFSVESFWTNFIDRAVASHMHAFADACEGSGQTVKPEEVPAIREAVLRCAETVGENLKEAVRHVCRAHAPNPPSMHALRSAFSEVALGQPAEGLPSSFRLIFEDAVLLPLSGIFGENVNANAVWRADSLEEHVAESLHRLLPIPETIAQIIERGKQRVTHTYVNAVMQLLLDASESGKETITGTEGKTYCALTAGDFSWEWVEAVRGAVEKEIETHVTAPHSASADDHMRDLFRAGRKRIFLTRVGSALEKILHARGIGQETCTAVRGLDCDFESALRAEVPPIEPRHAITQRLFLGRDKTPLFPGERELFEQFFRITLTPERDLELQLQQCRADLEALGRRCCELCHAGDPGSRTPETLLPFIRPIAEDVLRTRREERGAKGSAQETASSPHIQALRAAVADNQAWIDSFPHGERSRALLGYLERIMLWHEEACDYLERCRVLGEHEAGDAGDILWKVQSVTTLRAKGIIEVRANGGGKPAFAVDRAKLQAFFEAMEVEQRSVIAAKGGVPTSPEIEPVLQRLLDMGRELRELQLSLLSADPADALHRAEAQLGQVKELRGHLRGHQEFIDRLPAQAAVLLARLQHAQVSFEEADRTLQQALREADELERAAMASLTEETNGRRDPATLDEWSARLAQRQAETAALREVQGTCPFDQWAMTSAAFAEQVRESVAPLLPPETALPEQTVSPPLDPHTHDALATLWEEISADVPQFVERCVEVDLYRETLIAASSSDDPGTPDQQVRRLRKQAQDRQATEARVGELRRLLEQLSGVLHASKSP